MLAGVKGLSGRRVCMHVTDEAGGCLTAQSRNVKTKMFNTKEQKQPQHSIHENTFRHVCRLIKMAESYVNLQSDL